MVSRIHDVEAVILSRGTINCSSVKKSVARNQHPMDMCIALLLKYIGHSAGECVGIVDNRTRRLKRDDICPKRETVVAKRVNRHRAAPRRGNEPSTTTQGA